MRAHIALSHAAIALVLLSPLLACSTDEGRSAKRTATTAPANRAPAAGPDADGAKVRLHDAAGVVLLEIKRKD